MYALARLEVGPRQPEWLGLAPATDDNDVTEGELGLWAEEHYSEDLLDVINGCLAYRPDARPSFYELLGLIATGVETSGKGLEGVRPEEFDPMDEVQYDPDEYMIGMESGGLKTRITGSGGS